MNLICVQMAHICKILVIVFLAAVYVVVIKTNDKVVDLSCNFANDLCNWYQDENNDLNWTFNSGGNDSSSTGLAKDHDVEADHYIFIESNGTDDEQPVSLVSETQSPGNYCMTFWYKMYGNDSTALIVFLLNNETIRQKELWNRTNDETSSEVWLEVKLSIESHQYFKLKFSGTVSGGSDGYIAVNRFLFDSIWCAPDCDFDSGWCGWAGGDGSKEIDWERSSEFSNNTSKYVHFARANSSLENTTTTFVLEHPRVYSGAYCLSFWYRIYHADGLFKIYLTYLGTGRIQPITEHQLNGYSDGWTLFQEGLKTQESFEISIKVIFNQPSVIHIDDINLSCGLCGCGCCSFEHRACSWKIAIWRTITGQAESEKASPAFDHTLQSKDGHYAYMDKNGTIAFMESPEVLPGVYCFSFWYFMNDDGSMKLEVFLNERGLDQTPNLFSKSENQSDEWRHAEIQINSTHNFSLHFVGTLENNSGGGIAVDDIHICPDQCKTNTFPPTTTTYSPTQSSRGSGNGLLVVIAVATSCIAAIILAIFFFIIWRKTHGARKKNSIAVENKLFTINSTIHFTNRSAVNDHLQHDNTNSGIDVQDSSSDYNYIDFNTIPMNSKETYGHQKVTKHSENVDYSHSKCSKQNCSNENDSTNDQTNEINSKRMMKEKEDPKYDHTVTKIKKEKSCTGYEYLHLERTTGEKDIYTQALPGSEALGGKPQSQKSYGKGEKDKTRVNLEKQDGQTEMETLPDASHEYFTLEKTELQQS